MSAATQSLTLTTTRREVAVARLEAVAGVFLLFVGAGFLTVIMLGASIAPNYDYAAAAISDLGVIGGTALLFNAMLVIIGGLNVAAGVLLYRATRRRSIPVVFTLGGIGAVGAGLFPLNTGELHSLFALTGFVFFNVEALVVGLGQRNLVMRLMSLVAGTVGLIFVGVMIVGDGGNPAVFGPIGHGGAERMIAYPAMLWLLSFGGYLIAGGDRQDAVR